MLEKIEIIYTNTICRSVLEMEIRCVFRALHLEFQVIFGLLPASHT